MIINKRLTKVFEQAKQININDGSKIIIFSDCHRGNNNIYNDFAHNNDIFLQALRHYYREGFTYIELGDGDELWENKSFSKIFKTHKDIFLLMKKFHEKKRLFLIWGNHDMVRKEKSFIKDKMSYYKNETNGKKEELFKDLKTYESLKLKYQGDKSLFLAHGHQGDLMADQLWQVSRFFVRHFWRYLRIFNISEPNSPAENIHKKKWLVKKLKKWIVLHKQPSIFGHTHQSALPSYSQAPYFNTGCCVHPRCITGLEIENGKISLVKWWMESHESEDLKTTKSVLKGPRDLKKY